MERKESECTNPGGLQRFRGILGVFVTGRKAKVQGKRKWSNARSEPSFRAPTSYSTLYRE